MEAKRAVLPSLEMAAQHQGLWEAQPARQHAFEDIVIRSHPSEADQAIQDAGQPILAASFPV
jgi:hypothetical protein